MSSIDKHTWSEGKSYVLLKMEPNMVENGIYVTDILAFCAENFNNFLVILCAFLSRKTNNSRNFS